LIHYCFFLFILFYFFIEALLANAYEQPRSPSPDAASSSSTTSSATHRLHLHTSSTPPHFERAATLTDFSALAKPHHRRSSDTIDDRPSNVNAASTTSGAGGIVAASSSSSSPSATLRSFLRRAPSTSDASRDANNANANATPSKQFDCSNLGLDLLPLARINLDVKRVCYTRSDVFVVFAFFFFFFFFFNSFFNLLLLTRLITRSMLPTILS
jgi:cytoskeletal protein RodZ